MNRIITVGIFLIAAAHSLQNKERNVVCYFGSWAVYRDGLAQITPEHIEPGLCDVFIYAFVGLDEATQSVIHLDVYNDLGAPWRQALLPLLRNKAKAQGAKFVVAIGGWNEGSYKYSQVIGDPTKRARLVANIVKFVETNDLDGFDIDWEFPTQRGGASTDKAAFTAFVTELKALFKPRGWLLSAAVSANALSIPSSYDVPMISKQLDMINLMTYDLHGAYEDVTGHNAPLYARDSDFPNNGHLNIAAVVKTWLDLGVDPSVLYLGTASYGRSFNLNNPAVNSMGAPASGNPPMGWTYESGFIGYDEICYKNGSTWTTRWDDQQQVPYAFNGNQWVGYDDERSIHLKACLAKEHQLGGVMLWTIETDDFRGNCGRGRYPLLRALRAAMTGSSCVGSEGAPPVPETPEPIEVTEESKSSTTEVWSTETSTSTSTTLAPKTESPVTTEAWSTTETTASTSTTLVPQTEAPVRDLSTCQAVGQIISDTADCSIFWYCASGPQNTAVPQKMICPAGLRFDSSINTCNHAYLVKC